MTQATLRQTRRRDDKKSELDFWRENETGYHFAIRSFPRMTPKVKGGGQIKLNWIDAFKPTLIILVPPICKLLRYIKPFSSIVPSIDWLLQKPKMFFARFCSTEWLLLTFVLVLINLPIGCLAAHTDGADGDNNNESRVPFQQRIAKHRENIIEALKRIQNSMNQRTPSPSSSATSTWYW